MQLQHQGNSRNGAIKHIFTRIESRRDHQRVFFIHFVTHALHLAVKMLLQIFLYEDLSTFNLTHVGCISLQNANRTTLCYIANTIK